ncbi:MAG: hypothetical protein E7047_09950 [Lentisphaerae bacterium]|nr:hypothetical protein [Lentisphaerota bacterium]
MKEKRFAHEKFPPEIQAKADQMNLDPAAVPEYQAPELPLAGCVDHNEFERSVKPHLLDKFYELMYGEIPPVCDALEFKVTSEGRAFNGLAIRREIDIICQHHGDQQILRMLLYIPAAAQGPVPVIFGLNFLGNIATSEDPEVTFVPFERAPELGTIRYRDNRADALQRGCKAYRWEFEKVLRRGLAAATICYHDIYLDRPDGFASSIMRFFYSAAEWNSNQRKSGAISAWAWGIFRALDCLEKQPEIDARYIIVHGHSRLGKTALWAGAHDQRIWMTVSNCSGTCGAKLTHRYFGEDFSWLDLWCQRWFCSKFREYVNRDSEFPVDQHFLMAAIAPRYLYIASAADDVYADPEGEFLSGKLASPVWNLYGKSGLESAEYPPHGKLIGDAVGYYLRNGDHEFMPENWDALLTFIEKHLPDESTR